MNWSRRVCEKKEIFTDLLSKTVLPSRSPRRSCLTSGTHIFTPKSDLYEVMFVPQVRTQQSHSTQQH